MLNFECFRNPPPECRPKPFWFLNSRLEKDELVKQIRAFRKAGLGGFFIHARFGLETPYLSEDWFNAIEICIEEAQKLELEVWLYDENPFPSGIGDMKISKQIRFRSQFIEYKAVLPDRSTEGGWISADYIPEGAKLVAVQKVSDGNVPQDFYFLRSEEGILIPDWDEGELSVFWMRKISNPNNMIFGIDYMNPDAVNAFIEVTHEEYRRRIGKWFGSVVKGVFTDEPTLLPWHQDLNWYLSRKDGNCAPFTDRLLEEINSDGKRIATMQEIAPALFYNVDIPGGYGELRKRYWEAVGKLYEQNFFAAYAKWCENNRLMLTGHVLLEEGLYFNHIFEGDPLRELAHLHIPGMDQLTSKAEQNSMEYMVGNFPHMPRMKTNVQGPKLVTSAAHLAGRRQVISESFGVGGWGMSYGQMKSIVNWEYALGVNRLCPHAFFYSIEGFRKFDAPPCHMHDTTFIHYQGFADYVGRLSWALSQGIPAAETAVLYPSSAFRITYAIGRQCRDDRNISDTYDLICSGLLKAHQDFEVIGEHHLAASRIKNAGLEIPYGAGQELPTVSIPGVQSDGDALVFKTVIVPSLHGVTDEVREKLYKFAENGGKLLIFNEDLFDSNIAIKKSRNIWNYGQLKGDDAKMRQKMGEVLNSFFDCKCMGGLRLEGNGAEKVYVVRRRMNDGWIWYFANTDEKCAFNGEVGFDAEAGYDSESVILMNPETGEISYANTDKLSIRLEPSDTVLIYVSHEKVSEKSNIQTPRRNIIRTSIELPQENWEFSINDLNSLPLPVWKLDIRNNGGQSVYHYSTSVVSNVYIRDVYLMLDDIEYRNAFMGLMDLTVLVNGRKIPKSEKWYIDKGFHLFPIEKIPAGQSLIEVIIRHSSWSGEPHLLTSPGALLGKFGVVSDQSGWLIVEMPSRLRFDGWNIQGYPFYSGTAEYALETEMPDMSDSAIIRVSEVSTCAELIVDGVSMGTRLWAPWEWKLPNTVSGKKVKITLRVTNTLANFLGNNLHAGPSTGAYIDVY